MIEKILKILKIKFQGEVILKDGTPCLLDGDLAVGVGIKINGPDGLMDLPDGNYELETGQIITVADGKITDIVEQTDSTESTDNEVGEVMSKEEPVLEVVMTEEVKEDIITETVDEGEKEVINEVIAESQPNPYDIILEKITQLETKLENLPTYTDELTKLKNDVDYIMGKMTLSTELKKSKTIDEKPNEIDSRMDIINKIRNNKK